MHPAFTPSVFSLRTMLRLFTLRLLSSRLVAPGMQTQNTKGGMTTERAVRIDDTIGTRVHTLVRRELHP